MLRILTASRCVRTAFPLLPDTDIARLLISATAATSDTSPASSFLSAPERQGRQSEGNLAPFLQCRQGGRLLQQPCCLYALSYVAHQGVLTRLLGEAKNR